LTRRLIALHGLSCSRRRIWLKRAVLIGKTSDPIRIISTISEQHRSRFQTGQQGDNETLQDLFVQLTVVIHVNLLCCTRVYHANTEGHETQAALLKTVVLAQKISQGPLRQANVVRGIYSRELFDLLSSYRCNGSSYRSNGTVALPCQRSYAGASCHSNGAKGGPRQQCTHRRDH
jgi:hypothetical protein